jgi:hypothetical protein
MKGHNMKKKNKKTLETISTLKRNIPKIQLIRKKAAKGGWTKGMDVELYIDGKRISTAHNFNVEVPAAGLAKVTVQLYGDVSIIDET